MNQPEFENLLQTARTRDLTDAELAKMELWLTANPAELAEWEALDRLLAAHALSIGATIVTNNEGDFADIPGLKVENWTL